MDSAKSSHIVEQLGLFKMPRVMASMDKDREERALENQLINTAKGFFKSGAAGKDDEEGKDHIDKTALAVQKRREKHLMQLDDTKRMYMDQILRKTQYYDDFDYFTEILGVPLEADDQGNLDGHQMVVNYKNMTKAQIKAKQEENRKRMRESRDTVYFAQLKDVLRVTPAELGKISIEVKEFPLRIGYIDKMIAECQLPILDLSLNSTFLTASECLVLASNQRVSTLRTLDLSCNPITAVGLLNLVHPRRSNLEKLTNLILYNCEIDYTQAYLISNDNMDECKSQLHIKSLNLSHNNLGFFLNYISELELINPYLEKLQLVNCKLNDEHCMQLADSKKITAIRSIDLSENQLERNFQAIFKVFKDKCDFLVDFAASDNPDMRLCPNMQLAKGKKAGGLPLLQRLDLSFCLKGDQQVCQLAQSSYLKDLKFLNLRGCKFGSIGLLEVLSSKNLRSLEILIARDNKVTEIEGPFSDLEEATEKQIKRGLMKLSVLDIRGNKLTSLIQSQAVNFLKDTVVIMWGNPLEGEIEAELHYPKHLFLSQELDDDPLKIPNQKHLFTPKRPFLDI